VVLTGLDDCATAVVLDWVAVSKCDARIDKRKCCGAMLRPRNDGTMSLAEWWRVENAKVAGVGHE
jgi:hypothetical protein